MTDHIVDINKKALSPAAQEVLDAVRFAVNAKCFPPWIAVAALRALANEVVPENRFGPPENAAAAQREITRTHILAIATQLEGQP